MTSLSLDLARTRTVYSLSAARVRLRAIDGSFWLVPLGDTSIWERTLVNHGYSRGILAVCEKYRDNIDRALTEAFRRELQPLLDALAA